MLLNVHYRPHNLDDGLIASEESNQWVRNVEAAIAFWKCKTIARRMTVEDVKRHVCKRLWPYFKYTLSAVQCRDK